MWYSVFTDVEVWSVFEHKKIMSHKKCQASCHLFNKSSLSLGGAEALLLKSARKFKHKISSQKKLESDVQCNAEQALLNVTHFYGNH